MDFIEDVIFAYARDGYKNYILLKLNDSDNHYRLYLSKSKIIANADDLYEIENAIVLDIENKTVTKEENFTENSLYSAHVIYTNAKQNYNANDFILVPSLIKEGELNDASFFSNISPISILSILLCILIILFVFFRR